MIITIHYGVLCFWTFAVAGTAITAFFIATRKTAVEKWEEKKKKVVDK